MVEKCLAERGERCQDISAVAEALRQALLRCFPEDIGPEKDLPCPQLCRKDTRLL